MPKSVVTIALVALLGAQQDPIPSTPPSPGETRIDDVVVEGRRDLRD